jgi:hypothetical protein
MKTLISGLCNLGYIKVKIGNGVIKKRFQAGPGKKISREEISVGDLAKLACRFPEICTPELREAATGNYPYLKCANYIDSQL